MSLTTVQKAKSYFEKLGCEIYVDRDLQILLLMNNNTLIGIKADNNPYAVNVFMVCSYNEGRGDAKRAIRSLIDFANKEQITIKAKVELQRLTPAGKEHFFDKEYHQTKHAEPMFETIYDLDKQERWFKTLLSLGLKGNRANETVWYSPPDDKANELRKLRGDKRRKFLSKAKAKA